MEKAFQERLYEQLSDAATPLWRLPYARQLELKFEKNRNVLLKLTGILRKKAAPKSTLCPLSPVVASVRSLVSFLVSTRSRNRPHSIGIDSVVCTGATFEW